MDRYSVRVEGISKTYVSGDIEVKALDNVSFKLRKGEFVAIIGPSGSGKSTLMNVLGTIDKPSSGRIYIDGIETSGMNENELAEFRGSKLGFVFQAYNLLNDIDAEKNVEMPMMVTEKSSGERKARAEGLLARLGLKDRLKMKPTQLSGGEQQRVAIARALANNPALILADEPTGNLDTKTGDGVIKLLREVSGSGKVTVVMVTHNPDLTKHCDKVIHIKDGKMEKMVER